MFKSAAAKSNPFISCDSGSLSDLEEFLKEINLNWKENFIAKK